MDLARRAAAFVLRLRAVADDGLREGVVAEYVSTAPVDEAGAVLDVVCFRAEQAEAPAREALVAIVGALGRPSLAMKVQRLREEAAGAGLPSLDRLLRGVSPRGDVLGDDDARVPDYGKGRPLTLGERKSLARRPDRGMLTRLLADPHPDVIHRVLANPRLTEDDVLTLATRRPGRPAVLREIAASLRWSRRPRVRKALVLNPATPEDVAMPLLGLLLRAELDEVEHAPDLSPALRAACRERLARLPPHTPPRGSDVPPKRTLH